MTELIEEYITRICEEIHGPDMGDFLQNNQEGIAKILKDMVASGKLHECQGRYYVCEISPSAIKKIEQGWRV